MSSNIGEGNLHFGILKPRFTGIPENEWHISAREKWRLNYIPYFGYLSCKYSRGRLDAFDLITNRYIRLYGVIWPDEFSAYLVLFKKKHPEMNGSRAMYETGYKHGGACWDYKRNKAMRIFGREGLFDCEPVNPKPKQRNKIFLELVAKEMRAIKQGYSHAIDKRNKQFWGC